MIRIAARRKAPILATAGGALAAVLGSLVLVSGSATATGSAPHVPPPPTAPTSADQIQNIDQVKTAIKAYYGDTVTATTDPVNHTTTLHEASATGAYAKEMAGIEATAEKYLDHPRQNTQHPVSSGTKAILLDIDDTTLSTYDYEIYSNFVYTPATNAAFVNNAVFPPTPGMPALVKEAANEGYAIFYLTGRPVAQQSGTVTNLTNAGYPVDLTKLYLKDVKAEWLSSCAPSCTTDQYKSLTRQHIESLHYDIVANFGDQYSDLVGGFADRTFKLPNPMYFLP